LLQYKRDQAWATLVSFLGLPAEPSWAEHILGVIEAEERIKALDGIGCQPVLILATTEEVLEWIGEGLRSQQLALPEKNGPIVWQRRSWQQVVSAELVAVFGKAPTIRVAGAQRS
jgi:hypothetical protein